MRITYIWFKIWFPLNLTDREVTCNKSLSVVQIRFHCTQNCACFCVSEGNRESTLPKYKANNVHLNVRNWHRTDFTSCCLNSNGYWLIGYVWNFIKPSGMNHNCTIILVCNNINIETKITELGYDINATTNQVCSKSLNLWVHTLTHSIQANTYDGNVISHK